MTIGELDEVSQLIEAAGRLREVRAASRRFLMLAAVEHSDAYENLLRDVADISSEATGDHAPSA
jgi:hypothetical protein